MGSDVMGPAAAINRGMSMYQRRTTRDLESVNGAAAAVLRGAFLRNRDGAVPGNLRGAAPSDAPPHRACLRTVTHRRGQYRRPPVSRRRTPEAGHAADGTPFLPFVEYDDEGYPSNDGVPNVENTAQQLEILYILNVLHGLHEERYSEALIASDLGVLPDPEDPDPRIVAPDILFCAHAGGGFRRSYRLGQEPVPDLVLEVLSMSTRNRDLGIKQARYLSVGVGEYWKVDPSLKYIPEGIHVFVRDENGDRDYRELKPLADDRHYRSKVLGLDFRSADLPKKLRHAYPEGGRRLRIRDPQTGLDAESYPELKVRAGKAEERASTAEERAKTAEQLVATEQEKRLEAQRARLAAEAEVARLRAVLASGEPGQV